MSCQVLSVFSASMARAASLLGSPRLSSMATASVPFFLIHLFEFWDEHGEELHDDRGRDVGADAEHYDGEA